MTTNMKINLAQDDKGGMLWVSGASYEQSMWLSEQGFWFYGRRSNARTVRRMTALGIPANTRYIPADNATEMASLADSPDLEWAPEAKALITKAADAYDASWATDADIDIPAPDGLAYRPYQKAGVAFSLAAFEAGRDGVLIGDEMGLGKTMEAIGVMAVTKPARTLVVAPASLLVNWVNEIEKWLPELVGKCHIVNGGAIPDEAAVVVMNYEKVVGRSKNAVAIRKALETVEWDLAILDEAHFLKNPKAQRTKFFFGEFNRGRKVADGLVHRVKHVIELTGTPIQNRVAESLTLLRAAGAFGSGGAFKDEGQFLFAHCGATKGGFGWSFDGATNLDTLNAKLRGSGTMIRRLKADVAKELPPKLRSVVTLPYDGALKCDFPDELLEGDFKSAIAALTGRSLSFEEIARRRAELAEAKADQVIDHVKMVLESEDKVLVFAHHQSLLNALTEAFDDGSSSSPTLIRIDGGVAPGKRQALVDSFQSPDGPRIALLSTHAAGVGLTLTAASTVVFAEADWNPAWCVQAEDRAHRIGQTAPDVNVQYLVLDGTLDAHVIRTMVEKMAVAEKVLDHRPDKPVSAAPAAPKPSPTPAAPKPGATRSVAIKARKDTTPETFEISDVRKIAIGQALGYMSGRCDGAIAEDDVGFNGRDAQSDFVQNLVASRDHLSDKQAAWALRVLRTYKNTQLKSFAERLGF